jgi:hypothetical protein
MQTYNVKPVGLNATGNSSVASISEGVFYVMNGYDQFSNYRFNLFNW